jgi:hypothetical protein
MRAHQIIHWLAMLSLGATAGTNIANAMNTPVPAANIKAIAVPFAFTIWGYFVLMIWKRPRQWGLGLGIFLVFVLGFQTFLWRLALADPKHHAMGVSDSTLDFILYEVPLAVAAVSCILLRFYWPKEVKTDPAKWG